MENNKTPSFIWTAYFKNSNSICQFDFETGKENLFKEVKDKFSELEYFVLWNNEKLFKVDLINGLILFNKTQEVFEELLKEKKTNIRLIFFRRHRVEITEKMVEKLHKITYFLGFQYNDKNGNNRQVILQIDSEGNWILKE